MTATYLGRDISRPNSITVTTINTGLAGEVNQNGDLFLYGDSLTSPEKFLSTFGHEFEHIYQWEDSILGAQNTQQAYMNEVQANEWEMKHVALTGYTQGFRLAEKLRNDNYNALTKENQTQIWFYKKYVAVKKNTLQ